MSIDKTDEEEIVVGDDVTGELKVFINKKLYHQGCQDQFMLTVGGQSKKPIPKVLEDMLVGKKIGDKIEISVDHLDEQCQEFYKNPNLHYRFLMTIKRVKGHKKFEGITDEFLSAHQFDNIDIALNNWAGQEKSRFDNALFLHNKRKLFDVLEESLKFDVPSELVEPELSRIVDHAKAEFQRAKELGKDIAEDENPDSNIEDYKKIALRRVQLLFIMKKIKKLFDVSINEEEVNNHLYKMIVDNPKQAAYYLNNADSFKLFKMELEENKLVEVLRTLFTTVKVSLTTPEDVLESLKDTVPGFDELMVNNDGELVPIVLGREDKGEDIDAKDDVQTNNTSKKKDQSDEQELTEEELKEEGKK